MVVVTSGCWLTVPAWNLFLLCPATHAAWTFSSTGDVLLTVHFLVAGSLANSTALPVVGLGGESGNHEEECCDRSKWFLHVFSVVVDATLVSVGVLVTVLVKRGFVILVLLRHLLVEECVIVGVRIETFVLTFHFSLRVGNEMMSAPWPPVMTVSPPGR